MTSSSWIHTSSATSEVNESLGCREANLLTVLCVKNIHANNTFELLESN